MRSLKGSLENGIYNVWVSYSNTYRISPFHCIQGCRVDFLRPPLHPDLSGAQRSKLREAIAATKDAFWAYHALHGIPNLTKAQRSALKKIT